MAQIVEHAKEVYRRIRRTARAMRGRELWYDAQVRRRTLRLGSVYGGWRVAPDLLSADSVVYSFGVGDDVTFDLAMIDHFGCAVHAFDPTPRSVRWVARQSLPPRFVFHELGIADFDGEASFVMRSDDPEWNAYNLSSDTAGAVETATCRVARLASIAHELGHGAIDLVKLDVEGAEYAVIRDLAASSLRPRQLLIEFHYWDFKPESLRATDDAVRTLNTAGYRIFARSPIGYEFSFILD